MFRQNNAILREQLFLSEPLRRQYGRRQVIGHTYDGTYIPACYNFYMFRQNNAILREQLFLSEPLRRQYGRRQVIGHTYDGTYIPACYITPTCFGKTMLSSGSNCSFLNHFGVNMVGDKS